MEWFEILEKYGFPIFCAIIVALAFAWLLKWYLDSQKTDKSHTQAAITDYKDTIKNIVDTIQAQSLDRENIMRQAMREMTNQQIEERKTWMNHQDSWMGTLKEIEKSHSAIHDKMSQGITEMLVIMRNSKG